MAVSRSCRSLVTSVRITTLSAIIDSDRMTRQRHRLVDVINCAATAAQRLCAEATLASTDRHGYGRSIPAFACAIVLCKRCSIRRQGHEETMASRLNLRALACLLHGAPRLECRASFCTFKSGTPRKPPRDHVGRFLPTGEPLRAQENGRTVISGSRPWDGLFHY